LGGKSTYEMGGVGYLAHMGNRRCTYRVLMGDVMKRDHLKDLGIDGG